MSTLLRRGSKFRATRVKSLRFSLVASSFILVVALSVYTVLAAIPLSTSTTYSEPFNIGTSATATLPTDFRVDKITTGVRTLGTYAAAGTATERQGGDALSTTAANGIYNFGAGPAATATDRAVGFLSSSSATQSGNLYAQFVNNTGSALSGVQLSYDVEKYRNGSNTAGFSIQLYYSFDGAAWTSAGNNFLTSFPADANNNGFTPAPGATVNVNNTLGVNIPNGSNFYLAWNYSVTSGTVTSNAQALAIDNINVLGVTGAVTPSLTISDVTQAEGNAGTTNFNFTVSLSSPAQTGGVSFTVNTADGTTNPANAGSDYVAIVNGAGSIPEGSSSTQVTVQVNGDTTPEQNETFFVNVTNVTGATLGDGQGLGTITNDDISAGPLRIHDIQGASHLSPHAGETVTNVPGIVTAKRTATADGSKGFYLQDPSPDADDATSEGIFVFTTNTTILNSVNVGDSVLVSGSVSEFRPGGASSANLTVTEITGPTVTPISSGNSLPAVTVVGTGGRIPPMEVIEDDSAGDVETSNVFDPASDGIDFYESLEHMRVQVNNAVVTGPTATFGSGFPNKEVYVIGDNGAHASVRTPRGGIVIRPNDFNPERIVVTNLFQTLGDLNVADTFTAPIVGIYDYNFGKFLLHATSALTTASGGLTQEVATVPGAGQLTIATFNVENLDPGDGAARFDLLASLIINNLRSPDLITVEEIQDNNGPTNDAVVDADDTFGTLIAAIELAGGPSYEYRQINPVDDQDGGEPGGNIRVGFLFRTDRGLSFVDRPGGTPTSSTTVNNNGGMPELSFSPGRIDPTNAAFNNSRKPLAGEFTYNGRKLFVIGNHFNSKGGDDPTFGRRQPPVLSSEVQRLQQAQIVNNFVDSILAVDANANIVVLGDINDFQFSAPMNVLTGNRSVLHPLIETLPVNERYSYDFQGNSQTLDHIIVSNNLFRTIFKLDVVHVNSEFAVRASDHDPQVAYFSFVKKNRGADFDGDAEIDVSVWRPSDGNWLAVRSSDGQTFAQQWGLGSLGDVIVPGDYDKDGITDAAVWRAPTGFWYINRSSDGATDAQQWGSESFGDVPVPQDYDGDGQTDLAVFRTSDNSWYIQLSSTHSLLVQQFGLGTDKPVPADYDGDGKADIAVWRASTGFWYILNSLDGSFRAQPFGSESLGDVAVPEDYDGDGKADLAVWRGPTGFWYVLKSSDGTFTAQQWGGQNLGDIPVPEDYDNDGKADLAVWREPTGFWYILKSSDGSFTAQQWGAAGDKPLPAAYIRP